MTVRSIVSLIPCPDYDRQNVQPAVDEAVQLAELVSIFEPGKSVLVKPNLLSTRDPKDAVTTHPAVVRAVAQLAKQRRCTPSIGDSPPFSGENPIRWQRMLDATGMTEVASDLGIELKRFEDGSVDLASPDGVLYRSFEIAVAVAQADILINVAKLKTHGLTGMTGAVKNLFGCVPGLRKGFFHVRAADDRVTFAQMLVDLCRAFPSAAHVMDAVVAMEGEGPNNGTPKHVGAVLASSDPVALDAVASALVGVDSMSIHTTRLAHEQGIGCGDLAQIEVRGASIESVKVKDFKLSSGANEWEKIPFPIRQMLRKQLIPSPRMIANECVGCGDCVTACPVKALTPGKPPYVDYGKCIRCYCCHEVCNPGAIDLTPGFIGKLFATLSRKK